MGGTSDGIFRLPGDCPCMFFDSSLHHSNTPLLRDYDSPKRRHLDKATMEVKHHGTT
jgi:hypothetical protein